MKKQCASCGKKFEKKFTYCPWCSSKYTGESYKKKRKQKINTCPFCNTVRKKSDVFCTNCGYSFILHDKIISVKNLKDNQHKKTTIAYQKKKKSLLEFVKRRKNIFPFVIIFCYALVFSSTYLIMKSEIFPIINFSDLITPKVNSVDFANKKLSGDTYLSINTLVGTSSDKYINSLLNNTFDNAITKSNKLNQISDIDQYGIFTKAHSNEGYQLMIADYLEGILKTDYNLYSDSFPYFLKDSINTKYQTDATKKDYLKQILSWLKNEYGDNIKLTAKTTYEKPLSNEELLFLQYDFESFCNYPKDFKISKAVNINIEITYTGSKKTNSTGLDFIIIYYNDIPYLTFTHN